MAASERESRTAKKRRRSTSRPHSAPPMSVMSPEAPQGAGTTVTAPITATATAVLSSPLDHILIFGHGWFQRLALLCTMLAFFTTVLHVAAYKSLARPVDHWCRAPAEYAHLPVDMWRNTSVPFDADGVTRSHCLRYEPPVPSEEGEGFENRSMIPCDAGWDYGVDATSGKPVNSIIKEWNLVCDRRWIKTVLNAAYMFGGVLAAPLAGIAADRIGRRPVLHIGLFLLGFAGITLVFAKTLLLFAVLRALVSAAAASTLITSAVVLFEVTDTKHRALYCSLSIAGGRLAASFYGALVYDLISDWKAVQVAYMVPSCVLVVAVYLMEESPCWLLAVLDVRRAENVLTWAARVNRADQDNFKFRLSELRVEHKRHQEQTQDPGSSDVFSPPQGAAF